MDLYPAAPARAPAATLPPSFVLRVALVIGAIALFVAVYLGALLAATWSLVQLLASHSANIGVILVAAADLMLILFLLKGLFMRAEPNKALLLVDTSTQPDLFAFLRRLCAEAGCGFPRRVYLSHEVNASVFRRVSLLSALWPE